MDKLISYLQYPFVRYALITGAIIALCSALLGVILVLRHFSFIGDGLSHVAFGAMTVTTILKMSGFTLVLPITIACAIFLLRNNKTAGDAKIAVLSVSSLAFGYLAMNLFSSSANLSGDVCSTLFGSTSILTLSINDVISCIVLGVLTITFFIVFYNRIFSVTFDEDFAKTNGIKTQRLNSTLAVLIAVVIVLSMSLVGSLLVSALIIFPVLSAMCIFKSFKSVTITAAAISVICSLSGMMISILAGTPVGSTIVAVDAIVYVIALIIRRVA